MENKFQKLNYILIGALTIGFLYLMISNKMQIFSLSQLGFLLALCCLTFYKMDIDHKLLIPFWVIFISTITINVVKNNIRIDSSGGVTLVIRNLKK